MTLAQYTENSPAGKILTYLRRHGEATIKDLEELLGISTTAVREHLAHLEAKGLLATRQARGGPGRPRLVYSLTLRAEDLFPKEYDTLVTLLLREIASREGKERLNALLEAVGQRLAEEYRGQVVGNDVEERLARLRVTLEARGIPVEVTPDGAIQVFACPYHDVAREHAGVCTMERRMLEQVLGERVEIEGTIREGRRSCHFQIARSSD
ncbi:MAG: DeoR family transcriptional regulator [Roseiflexaceae bacterium]|nr:DeoR family transcriptional regulator [Roseiflexaceae bacterium]